MKKRIAQGMLLVSQLVVVLILSPGLMAHLQSKTRTIITSVSRFSPQPNQKIVILGRGFGEMKPFSGDTNYLRIYDATRRWEAGWDHCQNGCPDEVSVAVAKWSNSRIVIDGFSGHYGWFWWKFHPGDHIVISVWNPQTGDEPASYSLMIPAISGGAKRVSGTPPKISKVVIHTNKFDLHDNYIEIDGTGFGSVNPYPAPATTSFLRFLNRATTSPYLEIHDSRGWNAGYTGDHVGVQVEKWTNTQIDIDDFTGLFIPRLPGGSGESHPLLGYYEYRVLLGDTLTIKLWNSSTGAGPSNPWTLSGNDIVKVELMILQRMNIKLGRVKHAMKPVIIFDCTGAHFLRRYGGLLGEEAKMTGLITTWMENHILKGMNCEKNDAYGSYMTKIENNSEFARLFTPHTLHFILPNSFIRSSVTFHLNRQLFVKHGKLVLDVTSPSLKGYQIYLYSCGSKLMCMGIKK